MGIANEKQKRVKRTSSFKIEILTIGNEYTSIVQRYMPMSSNLYMFSYQYPSDCSKAMIKMTMNKALTCRLVPFKLLVTDKLMKIVFPNDQQHIGAMLKHCGGTIYFPIQLRRMQVKKEQTRSVHAYKCLAFFTDISYIYVVLE